MGKMFYIISLMLVIALGAFFRYSDQTNVNRMITNREMIVSTMEKNLSDEQYQIVEQKAAEFNLELNEYKNLHHQWYMQLLGDKRIDTIEEISII